MQREAVRSSEELRTTESRNVEARDSVVVAERDTILETTTITYVLRQAQKPNEPEDTVKVTTVTDRVRARSRDAIAVQKTKVEVKTDTVFVEKRDSIEIRSRPEGAKDSWGNQLARVLRLVLWIIIGLIGLVIVVRIKR